DHNQEAQLLQGGLRGWVMTPMAKARGLQLARHDNAAASGCMTAARQGRRPAAWAAAEAGVPTSAVTPSGEGGPVPPTTRAAGNLPHGPFAGGSARDPVAWPTRSA